MSHEARDGGDLFWNFAYVAGGEGKIQSEKIREPAADESGV